MMASILADLIRVNLAGAAAILVVLACRAPARRLVGPEMAYRLWAAPPLAALATLMPAPVVEGVPPADVLASAVKDWSEPALGAWALGIALMLAALGWAQQRFVTAARAGRAGPSVVGVISPRIYMPPDDGRYTAEERAVIRAHEHEHVVRSDPRAGALACALQVLCWFNPLVHLGAHAMRLDQELACDAAVLRRRPHDRVLYARTLLKTQLDAQMLPLGCRWPAKGLHPLEVRVGLLKSPVRYDGMAGPILIAMGLTILTVTAWSVQPPAPRHPQPLLELWKNQHYQPVSVMLISRPARDVPH
jgi:beta-lactamase regulating signal transducer with metallopeptidase domain